MRPYALLVAALFTTGICSAQTARFPEKPVRFVVGFTPGGPSDILARAMGQKLAESWTQQVLIENRPGAGGNIAAEAVAKSAPDGYTWLLGNNSILATNQSLYQKLAYDPVKDFAPVVLVAVQPNILVVNPAVPANSVGELIALARSKPGALNYASSGPGTPYHMAGELFKAMAGLDIVHVPHKESSGARTSILGGQVQMMFDAITVMAKQAEAGKVRAIATSGRTRSAVTPNLPTVAEAGVPGYEATIWLGVMAPAGTPKPIVDKLNTEIQKVISLAEVKEAWAKQGAFPMYMTPEEFTKYMAQDIEKWAKVVKLSGAKVD